MFSPVRLDIAKTQEVFGYNPEDLSPGSHEKVVVECLNCHRIIHREFRNVRAVHQCPVVDGNKKKCFRCGQWKDLSLFNKNPNGSGGVAKMCRECHNLHPSVVRSESNRKARLRRAIVNGDIEYYIKFRVNCIRNHSKKKNIQFDIDAEYMQQLWDDQEGCCYYTSIPMKAELKQIGFQAWDSPSVDRKEPANGYVRGNVVWCTFGANSFKQSLNEEQFARVVGKIKWWDANVRRNQRSIS